MQNHFPSLLDIRPTNAVSTLIYYVIKIKFVFFKDIHCVCEWGGVLMRSTYHRDKSQGHKLDEHDQVVSSTREKIHGVTQSKIPGFDHCRKRSHPPLCPAGQFGNRYCYWRLVFLTPNSCRLENMTGNAYDVHYAQNAGEKFSRRHFEMLFFIFPII